MNSRQPKNEKGSQPAPRQPLSSTQMFKLGDAQAASPQGKKQSPHDAKPLHRFVTTMQRGVNEAAVVPPEGKIPLRVFFNALGQLFYLAGFQTEYFFLRMGRTLRRAARALRAAFWGMLTLAGVPLLRFLADMWDDLSSPWRHLRQGLHNLHTAVRAEREAGGAAHQTGTRYVKSGLRAHRSIIVGALSYLLPVGALAVLVFTVTQVLSYNYALAVHYKGDVICFIENENVWERAQNLVRERIVAAASGDTWTAYPTFTITPVSKAACTGATKLADKLIETSSDEIQNATGVRVNGELLGVATDGPALQKMLDDTLAPYLQPGNPTHRVEFVQSIELVPGVYYTSSIGDTAQLIGALQTTPGLLNVKTMDRIEYDEPVPYTTQEKETDEYYTGVRRVVQNGKDGTQHVVAEVTMIDGVEVLRVPQTVTPVEAMTPKIIAVGTKQRTNTYSGPVGATGSGVLAFPVPGYSYITTQFGQGGHRGTDICAPYGTTILACDSGTVIEAGFHYSWGNYIKIDHGNGMATLYAHCSALYVSAGQNVARGQPIGAVGSTGNSSGNHCHLELYIGGSLTNPMAYVG